MDWFSCWFIALGGLVALYVIVRLALRRIITTLQSSFLGVVPLLPDGISRREYALVNRAGLSN